MKKNVLVQVITWLVIAAVSAVVGFFCYRWASHWGTTVMAVSLTVFATTLVACLISFVVDWYFIDLMGSFKFEAEGTLVGCLALIVFIVSGSIFGVQKLQTARAEEIAYRLETTRTSKVVQVRESGYVLEDGTKLSTHFDLREGDKVNYHYERSRYGKGKPIATVGDITYYGTPKRERHNRICGDPKADWFFYSRLVLFCLFIVAIFVVIDRL